MADSDTERRLLAAIMFTDMVGYTALSRRSEALALELLEEHRRLLRGLFPRYGGREIKTIGDGFLVEFASALEAAQCAVAIQRTLTQRNLSSPSDRQIQVRVGIHAGDIVHREGDVLGEGVNIASRIEPLAEPGGICISVDVARQIQHSFEAAVVNLGLVQMPNGELPVEVCRIVLPWERRGATSAASQGLARRKGARRTAVYAVVGMLLLGGLLGWALYYGPFQRAPEHAGLPTKDMAKKAASAEDRHSVAVLPFANLSADAADEYLSDGLTEEVIYMLTRVPGLRVAARTSSFVFKEKKEDIRKIGELLNVRAVVEGSVRKSGNRIRVSAQLINVADGYHLWSESYDRDMGDLFAVQQEIARQIADKLRLELSREAQQQLAKRSTQNAQAYQLYLKGLYWWNKRTRASLEKSIEFFNQALDQDPTFAAAHAALAACYSLLPEYAGRPNTEWLPKAQAAATKALQLDPSLAEAHAVLGLIRGHQWDWAGAEDAFKVAIGLNPNYATTHHWYSVTLRVQGRLDEATAEIRRAQELDPLSLVIIVNVGMCLQWSGQDDLAIQELQRGLVLDPGFMGLHHRLGDVYLAKGMLPEAQAEFQKVRALSGESLYGLGELGYVYARAGNRAQALEILTQLDEFGRQGYAVKIPTARVHLGLGDKDKAFVWLEQACRDHEGYITIKADPSWQELRSDPRFQELLRTMNLEK